MAADSAAASLVVNATELLRQPGTVRHVVTSVALTDIDAVDARLHGPVAVDVTLESTLDDVVVGGTLTVDWSDECRRCLRPVAARLRVRVDERYAPDPAPAGQAVDPDAFPIHHGQLDLAPMVREEVLLGVPDAPLCRPDCPGLCPTCGADRSEGDCGCERPVGDERWAVLDALREQD